ncbi:DUF433 domain-containing protein [Desulfococcaceae bacterium HSG9]|nr:DUF433 domain-containing protein [Desulfococcaceae bacterium HSG9]
MNKHVTIDPKVCNGKPVLRNTRIPVTVIIDQIAEIGSIQSVLHKYPELTFEQVTAALHYCHSVIEHTEFETKAA